MGGFEAGFQDPAEPQYEIPLFVDEISNQMPLSGFGTLLAGQFDWGGPLPKSNGGSRRFPQPGWQSGLRVYGYKEALL